MFAAERLRLAKPHILSPTVVINPSGQTSASSGWGTPASIAFGQNVQAGNSVIAALDADPTSAGAITWGVLLGSGGAALSPDIQDAIGHAGLFSLVGAASGKNSINITAAGASNWAAAAIEVSGIIRPPVATGISTYANGASTNPTLTLTPQAAGDLMVFLCYGFLGFTGTPFTGTPSTGWVFANSGNPVAMAAVIAPSTSPVTATWNLSGAASSNYGILGAVYA